MTVSLKPDFGWCHNHGDTLATQDRDALNFHSSTVCRCGLNQWVKLSLMTARTPCHFSLNPWLMHCLLPFLLTALNLCSTALALVRKNILSRMQTWNGFISAMSDLRVSTKITAVCKQRVKKLAPERAAAAEPGNTAFIVKGSSGEDDGRGSTTVRLLCGQIWWSHMKEAAAAQKELLSNSTSYYYRRRLNQNLSTHTVFPQRWEWHARK